MYWGHGTGMCAAIEHRILDKTAARTRELEGRFGRR
jgi:hypothetical protein